MLKNILSIPNIPRLLSSNTNTVETMVGFVVTEDVTETDDLSVGRQLSFLCIKHAPVAQGFLLWATQHCNGKEFPASPPYPTLAPGVLGLARIIGKYHNPPSRCKLRRGYLGKFLVFSSCSSSSSTIRSETPPILSSGCHGPRSNILKAL